MPTHEQTPAKEPNHLKGRCRNTVWEGNDQNHSYYRDDEFFPVYKLPA